MAEKHLTEAAWKAFAKGRDLKGDALIRALADWARAEREAPQDQLKALDAIDKQAQSLLKSAKGDKELASYLGEVDKALARSRKAAEQAAKQAVADAAAADEEEQSPALLTTKMAPLLRLVSKGETMHALVAGAGKRVAVMLSRKPISPARRKLLAEYLDESGIKYFSGECLLESNAHTFVLQTQVGGMAKKIKAALHEQTGLRLKVRCRGEGGETDDDDEAEEGAPVAQAEPTQDPSAAFNARLAALVPRIKSSPSAKVAAGTPQEKAVNVVASEAGLAARKKDFAAANAMLDQVEAALAGSAAPAAAGFSVAQLGKARIEWAQARAHAVAEFARLKAILQEEYRDDEDEQATLSAALRKLDSMITTLDEELADRLDEVLNADPAQRAGRSVAAKAALRRIVAFVVSDEILRGIDGNEYAPDMQVAAPLRARLQAIGAALG